MSSIIYIGSWSSVSGEPHPCHHRRNTSSIYVFVYTCLPISERVGLSTMGASNWNLRRLFRNDFLLYSRSFPHFIEWQLLHLLQENDYVVTKQQSF